MAERVECVINGQDRDNRGSGVVRGHWARKLSWKETSEEFCTSCYKVHDAVAYLVTWGLEHRVLGPIRAMGVDEIQYGKGHKYLTLVLIGSCRVFRCGADGSISWC